MSNKIFLGLDIGTDSVGWAVTDEEYHLKKFHGEPMWGSVLFDAANLKADRRKFRTARRRLERRKQRVRLIQELFAEEIANKDPFFFKREQESYLYREDTTDRYVFFNDEEFTDKDYHLRYPTIHHLINELMSTKEPHDVRLVYLACAWLVAHRGHFLSEVNKENIDDLKRFDIVYQGFEEYVKALSDDYVIPWKKENITAFQTVLPQNGSVSKKYKELAEMLFPNEKVPKTVSDQFPIRCDLLLKALCGSSVSLKDLFDNDAYADMGSLSLDADDEVLEAVIVELDEDGELIRRLKAIYDWSILIDALGEKDSISEAKIFVYNQHKEDLKQLKYFVKKYLPGKYDEVFRDGTENNYVAYSKHQQSSRPLPKKWADKDSFSEFLKKLFEKVAPEEIDQVAFESMKERIAMKRFLPKQKDTANRVIPYQLYWYELKKILENASAYLPFLDETDEDGLSVKEKILSTFTFKIPYYVGPLNTNSEHSWIVRKAEGKIYPWNFEKKVDLDKSEQAFINKMLNACTYLAGENCVPKESLLYQKYMVLNEINNIRINNNRISVELKQDIYRDVFCKTRKVTRKKLEEYLCIRGFLHRNGKEYEEQLSGIDEKINSALKSYHDFRRLLTSGLLSEEAVEDIIQRSTYTEDRMRFEKWLRTKYVHLSEADIKYISKLRYKDFGRLSLRFLNQMEGAEKDGGEVFTIMSALWNTQRNLMELLSDQFTFMDTIRQHNTDYYQEYPTSLEKRLEEMYISNAVKRPVLRTLEVVKEVTKALGKRPDKIFIEMTRGATESQKKKRTVTRKNQILDLYKKCDTEDVRILQHQLEAMGDSADNRLQSDKLFLYYMQLGRSIYSGKPIDIDRLGSKLYDIDHIYPQRLVKDDSILNNKVLCLSEENGQKKDRFPVPAEWRNNQKLFWKKLKDIGMMTDEKYKRLTRETGFTNDEKMGFINRQLTETSQSAKAVATLLQESCPETKLVYVKARLTAEFRQYLDVLKSRTFNDLHHAKDAYLNIVTGNVYDMRFSQRWFSIEQEYSVNTSAIFSDKPWIAKNSEAVWGGSAMIGDIKKTVAKNNAHLTVYSYCRKGGFFDQLPLRKNKELVPRKLHLPTEKYGGYNKTTASFFVLTKYKAGKECDIIVLPVELLCADRFLADKDFAKRYAMEQISKIRKKTIETVSFPLGMRLLKINTLFSFDGYRGVLCGKAGGGSQIIMAGVNALAASQEWQNYTLHLDNFIKKCQENKGLIYDAEHDKINRENNIKMYDLLSKKMSSGLFSKRPNNPASVIENGKDCFAQLSIEQQVKALLSLLLVFSRASGGIDLSLIGGKARAAATFPSALLSAWGKNYTDIRIIDTSVTGLWEQKSENLLDLL